MENQLVKITHINDNNDDLLIYGKVGKKYFEIIFDIYTEENPAINNNESEILIKDDNGKYYFCSVSISNEPLLIGVENIPIPINNFNYNDYNIPAYIYCIMIGMVSTNL